MSKPSENKPDDFWIFILIAVICYWGASLEKKIDKLITKEPTHVESTASAPVKEP